MKNIVGALVLLFMFSLLHAQTQYSAYTAVGKGVATPFLRDYQSLGINSSALGWGTGVAGKNTVMGTSEFAFGISSPELDKKKLQNFSNAIFNQIRNKDNAEFDFNSQLDAVEAYANASIAMSFDYNWLGASYFNEKLGGVAVSVRENYNWYSQINEQTTDLIFRGKLSSYFDSLTIVLNGDTSVIANNQNISQDTLQAVISGFSNNPLLLSQLLSGSKIKFMWNREYNFGYGRKIIGNDSTLAIYAGIGGRFIQSMAYFDLEAKDNGLSLTSSMSSFFNIDYDAASQSNISNAKGLLPSIVGSGYGIDLSASVVLLNKLRIAAAVNNIGQVTYNTNVYSVKDTIFSTMNIDGLSDYSVNQSVNQLLEDGGLLSLENEAEWVVVNPATFRLGGSLELIKNRIIVGVDIVAPFNKAQPGSLQNPVIAFGGDIRPAKWLQLSTGYFGGGVYSHNIPLGINFILGDGSYEFGIASRDALSFFLDDTHSISTAFGFARVRF